MKLNYLVLAIMLSTSVTANAAADEQQAVVSAKNTPSGAVWVTPTKVPLPVSQTALVPAQTFTPEQEARIQELTRSYLLAHPDILVDVSRKLEAQQQVQQLAAMTQAVLHHQDALLNDKSTPSYGPTDAKVAFIEFFDYQCSVCARQEQVIESLMKANPQVRYIFKEWPIFSQRWEPSMTAARTGLQVWQQKGADAYLAYHKALYATGHDEGKLTQADITNAAAQTGKLKGENDEMQALLSATDKLAQNLGLRGTPGMIVMPVNGATADNVTVIPGGADLGMLQSAIERATR
ncbi:DsbA family protein [Serratia liquefaciens]|uniref:DsbA family protein n=1 Tax=Serratia liquefaciens TaxID=614 RepID=UPI00382F3340